MVFCHLKMEALLVFCHWKFSGSSVGILSLENGSIVGILSLESGSNVGILSLENGRLVRREESRFAFCHWKIEDLLEGRNQCLHVSKNNMKQCWIFVIKKKKSNVVIKEVLLEYFCNIEIFLHVVNL